MSGKDPGEVLFAVFGRELEIGTREIIGSSCIETDAVHNDKTGEAFRKELLDLATNWLLDHDYMGDPGQARVVAQFGKYGVSVQPLNQGVGPTFRFVADEKACEIKRLVNVEIVKITPDKGSEEAGFV